MFSEYSPWLFASGAAIGSLLAAFWTHVRSAYQVLASRVLMSITLDGYQAEAMLCYLRSQFAASTWGPRAYVGWMLYVQPKHRVQIVSMEITPPAGRIYWQGWRALWVSSGRTTEMSLEGGVNASNYDQQSLTVTFLRGVYQPDQLVIEATEYFNRQVHENCEAAGRHYVKHVFGSAGRMRFPGQQQGHPAMDAEHGDLRRCLQYRPLGYEFHQLGTPRRRGRRAVDRLALDENGRELVLEAERWLASEQWHRERELPWRRGWLLYGEPGTGKTAFARAIAEDLDLPVFSFDLASLYNDELQSEWSSMLTEVPCMALLEDIDAVFHGRENVVAGEKGGLTFDCLLNCLDGVQRADGLLLAITTNHLERIDPALGIPVNGRSSRPGRVDRVVEFTSLNDEGRRHLASSVLPDAPELWDLLVEQGEGDTGAQFQDRCAQLALALEFGDREKLAECLVK